MTALRRFASRKTALMLTGLGLSTGVLLLAVRNQVGFRASVPQAFVSYVSSFEDFQKGEMKSCFGWGGTGKLYAAAAQAGHALTRCRAHRLPGEFVAYSFEVKVEPQRGRFRVVSLLKGAEENPKMAACLRDRLQSVSLSLLKTLPDVPESAYRLVVDVQSNLGGVAGADTAD